MGEIRLHHISDEELVVGALLGDLGAFDELVYRFRRAVVLVAQQITGSRDTAEDVAQDTFLLAFKALPQLKAPAKFPGWLCSIARRRAQRVMSQDCHSMPTETSLLDVLILEHSGAVQDPAEAVAERDNRDLVNAALHRLPIELLAVLHLYYYEDWPVGRISEFLSLPRTTVKWRLHSGRQRMRSLLVSVHEHRCGAVPRCSKESPCGAVESAPSVEQGSDNHE